MNQNEISDLPKLRRENYENIFNVYKDGDDRYYYNLLQNVIIPQDLPAGYYETYNVQYDDTWPLVSYRVYNTPNLWWVILSANNIIDPTKLPTPGTSIKYLQMRVVKDILNQISAQSI